MGSEPVDYCRAIETYLCRKNDGHLIRVVGPSFELVSQWAADGVPLKIACEGIDRYFERYYAKGPRRRPVRVEFCDADVRDVFDEWRRAIGLAREQPEAAGGASEPGSGARGSLPSHLERAVLRLTSARATGLMNATIDPIIDRASRLLDAARATPHGVRGAARRAVIGELADLDRELLDAARAALEGPVRASLERDADEELASFRDRMPAAAYDRARAAAFDGLLRQRFGLPTLKYE